VKHAQEAKAWELLEKLHPLVWQRSIAVLAHDELFPSSWYDPVIARLEQTLVSEQKLLSRLELMSLIVQVERPAGNDKEKEYLKRMVRELLHSTDKVRVNEIELVISAAEQLSDVDALGDLIGLTKALPEGDQFSRSNTLTRVVVALAHSGATDCAWDLVPAIEDSTKRVEAYVRVCQSTPQTEVLRRERFDVALSFIRSLDNTGWIPNFWGELAVLANQLDLRKERDLCVVKAVAGVERAESGYSFGFNLLNSGYVAQTLDEMGLDIQARQLLRVGLGWLSGESYGSLIGLRHLARTMGRIGVHDLWDDVLTTIREIEKPTERAEALLGTTYAIAHQKDPGQARGLLPEVLDHLVEIPADARLLRGFGEMLCEIGDSGDGLQHELIVRAIARARISDRQTAILWTAGLLHAFAASSLDIAKEAWKRFCRADSVLTS